MLLINSSSNCPEGPTNGRPCLSSWKPGPSPTKSILACGLPSPGTAFVRPLQRSHFEQVETSAAISLSISSEDILLYTSFQKNRGTTIDCDECPARGATDGATYAAH